MSRRATAAGAADSGLGPPIMPLATAIPTSSQAPQLIDTVGGPPAAAAAWAKASRNELAAQ
jgi:hypothetical protein